MSLGVASNLKIYPIVSISFSSLAWAGSRYGDSFKGCQSFKSGESFVREATLYCLKTGNPSSCEREAAKYFKKCNFDGDFQEINRRVYREIFALYFLVNASQRAYKN
jgi:hypothetical protein